MNIKILAPIGIAMLTVGGNCLYAQANTQATPSGTPQRAQMQSMTPEQRADMEIKRMDSNLKLSDDQKTQLKTLIVNINNQRDQNRTAAGGDRQKMMQLDQSLRQQKEDGINKILTSDQQTKYKQMQQNRPQMRQQQQGQAAPGGNQ